MKLVSSLECLPSDFRDQFNVVGADLGTMDDFFPQGDFSSPSGSGTAYGTGSTYGSMPASGSASDSGCGSVNGSTSDSGSDNKSFKPLVWIDHLSTLNDKAGSSESFACKNDVEEVKKRVDKRKRRRGIKNLALDTDKESKRARNTLAARRYRQKRLEEVEVLLKKIKELENDLSTAKLEAKWWKMESERWHDMCQPNELKKRSPGESLEKY